MKAWMHSKALLSGISAHTPHESLSLVKGVNFDNPFLIFQDNNLGLVMQVVSSMYKRNIQRLTQTYLTLSLQDIANTVQLRGPKEAEMHVLQMVGGDLLGCVSLQG